MAKAVGGAVEAVVGAVEAVVASVQEQGPAFKHLGGLPWRPCRQ